MPNFLTHDRATEILAGLAAGMSVRAVAKAVGVSTNTVFRYKHMAGQPR